MIKKLSLALLLLLLSQMQLLRAQETNAYNDTSYFLPFDIDFNLIMSASKGHPDNVRSLLSRGAKIDAITETGVTSLMYATDNGDIEMVKLLIEKGADPNMKPLLGPTALMSAVTNNRLEIAEFLVQNKADPNLKDSKGATALIEAASLNHHLMADMLIYYKADPELSDNRGNTPLIAAAYTNALETVRILVNNEVDVNKTDKDGFTPLMIAVQRENKDIAAYLMDNGADVNLANNGNMTALSLAVNNSDYALSEMLINKGADANHKISGSRNLLMLAEEKSEDEIIALLLANGAEKNKKPDFSQITTGPDLNFNAKDFNVGYNIGLFDTKYKLSFNTGFNFRPLAVRILDEVSDTLAYQYWERRYQIFLGIEKKFRIIGSPRGWNGGPFIELKEILTFGGYRGSTGKPQTALITAPGAGLFCMNNWLILKLRYEYINLNVTGLRPVMFSLGASFSIPTKGSRHTNKEINWINEYQ